MREKSKRPTEKMEELQGCLLSYLLGKVGKLGTKKYRCSFTFILSILFLKTQVYFGLA